MILYKNGMALINGRLVKTDIVANHGRIIEIAADIVPDGETEVVDCSSRYIIPALVDIHTHGAVGYDFNTADLDGMRKIVDFYASHGVGTVLPTVMTDSDEVICRQLALICELAKEYPEVKGIHLEGPFISREYRGAMPERYLQKPSVDKFCLYQKAANGLIKIVTVSPELPDAIPFIREISDADVVVSLGHSGADAETVERALSAGAKSFTHWGNAMSQLDRRNLNMVGSAVMSKAYCEVICDGKHVDKGVLNLLVKAKSLDYIIGVTDSMMATGLADGRYSLGAVDVTVTDGDATVSGTDVRAGSTLDAYTGLTNVIQFCNLPLEQALKMWTVNPARLLGLSNRIGTIEVGKDADFIIFG